LICVYVITHVYCLDNPR